MSKENQIVHLHTHSHYSLLDAMIQVDNLASKAKRLNMPAIALTDHGNIFGLLDLYYNAKKNNIKPILGCELYISTKDHKEKSLKKGEKNYHHLVVLAQNNKGYENLIKIASIAYTEGFYYRPRISKKTLKDYTEGLIALSGCLSSELSDKILQNDKSGALKLVEEFYECFGQDNFFLEMQDHGLDEQKIVNKEIINISKKTNIPLVVTNDVHYLNQEDHKAHDALICIPSKNTIKDKKRKKYHGKEFYLKSYDEMVKVFPDHKDAIKNSVYIADKCNVNISETIEMPSINIKDNSSNKNKYLQDLCLKGLEQKYDLTKQNDKKDLKERLDYELSIINKMNFTDYFLIVHDFIKYANEQNISVGPGRGSAAGSIVSYTLGITKIDPIKYGLIFERFLNPQRISMPDIDIDFQDNKREQIIQYVKDKYSKDNVANIITFGKLKAKAVLRDIGRVMGFEIKDINNLISLFPNETNLNLSQVYNLSKDFKNRINSSEKFKELYEVSLSLEGVIRNASTHAAGIIITKNKLVNKVPLYLDKKTSTISSQYEGSYLEKYGILKMDFLGLKNLTVIQKAVNLIKAHKNIYIDIDKISLDDKNTFKLLQNGNTLGIFQLESSGIQKLIKELEPNEFEDIISTVALYRPGPLNSGMVEEFIKRKTKQKKTSYLIPELKPILNNTYGVIVYQEQIMKISQIIAGFTIVEADELRKAIGKKLVKEMELIENKFINGALNKGFNKKIVQELYDQIKTFGQYGFNRSHSVSYALISYQNAFLKTNFPIEYMTAVLSCEKNNHDNIKKYILECKKMNIKLRAPSINDSDHKFHIKDDQIVFGLSSLKNIGETTITKIINEGKHEKYTDIFNLVERNEHLNKKALESLIKSGATDILKYNRRTLLDSIDFISNIKAPKETRKQNSLFSLDEIKPNYSNKINIKEEYSKIEILKYEQEVFGYYITDHPIMQYINILNTNNILYQQKDIIENDQKNQAIAVIVHSIKFVETKSGNSYIKLEVENLDTTYTALDFDIKTNPKKYDSLVEGEIIVIIGNKKQNENTIYMKKANKITDYKTVQENSITSTILPKAIVIVLDDLDSIKYLNINSNNIYVLKYYNKIIGILSSYS